MVWSIKKQKKINLVKMMTKNKLHPKIRERMKLQNAQQQIVLNIIILNVYKNMMVLNISNTLTLILCILDVLCIIVIVVVLVVILCLSCSV